MPVQRALLALLAMLALLTQLTLLTLLSPTSPASPSSALLSPTNHTYSSALLGPAKPYSPY